MQGRCSIFPGNTICTNQRISGNFSVGLHGILVNLDITDASSEICLAYHNVTENLWKKSDVGIVCQTMYFIVIANSYIL